MKVLIAVDGTESSWDAVHFAADLLSETDEVIVFNVASEVAPAVVPAGGLAGYAAAGYAIPAALDHSEEREHGTDPVAQAITDEAAAELHSDQTVVETGNTVQHICSYAESHEVDLVIVGTRDPGFFDRILTGGSTSREVVKHAPCSVLVVR